MLWLDMTMLGAVGFFIYPVINLIVILGLDLTSKKAIGTVAGFIGMMGYAGKTVESKTFGWMVDHFTPIYGKRAAWDIVIASIIACTFIAMVLLALTWRLKPRRAKPEPGSEDSFEDTGPAVGQIT
jgi:OPA family glycerol-3-phosphate transporter-like MFS transporter